MPQRRRTTTEDLRTAIARLPRETRVAMLEGISRNPIIAGAYSDREGICPMLAAHRAGGRTSAISFARAWDRFAFRDLSRARRRHCRPRRASARELLVLRTHLEASLLEEAAPIVALAAARAEHEALLALRRLGVDEAALGELEAAVGRAARVRSRRRAPSLT